MHTDPHTQSLAFVSLLVLSAVAFFVFDHWPEGILSKTPILMAVTTAKAGLVAFVFMEARRASITAKAVISLWLTLLGAGIIFMPKVAPVLEALKP